MQDLVTLKGNAVNQESYNPAKLSFKDESKIDTSG